MYGIIFFIKNLRQSIITLRFNPYNLKQISLKINTFHFLVKEALFAEKYITLIKIDSWINIL